MRVSLGHSLAPVASSLGIADLLMPAAAQACSVCMGSSPADHGYFWGILLLMAMPFTVGGLIGGWLFYTYRHGHRGGLTTAPALRPHRLSQEESLLPAMAGDGERDFMAYGETNGTKPAVWTPLQKEGTN